MKNLLLILICSFLVTNCVDSVTYNAYKVTNNTKQLIVVKAFKINDSLINDEEYKLQPNESITKFKNRVWDGYSFLNYIKKYEVQFDNISKLTYACTELDRGKTNCRIDEVKNLNQIGLQNKITFKDWYKGSRVDGLYQIIFDSIDVLKATKIK